MAIKFIKLNPINEYSVYQINCGFRKNIDIVESRFLLKILILCYEKLLSDRTGVHRNLINNHSPKKDEISNY